MPRPPDDGGQMTCDNYGRLTALALDPIEKKPLARFHPGSRILSVGSYGCSLACPFCQNDSISYAGPNDVQTALVPPDRLVAMALREKAQGNIGIAFTYNEPLVGWEYVRDTARLAHEAGLLTVLVSNGMASRTVFDELAPYIDAMNVDLKSFQPAFYQDLLKGDLAMVKDWIRAAAEEMAAGQCHLELTTLIIPGENDSDEEMRDIAGWIAGLPGGADIPLHISRFFPRHAMLDKKATPVRTIHRLVRVAKEQLRWVYAGNC